MTNLTQCPAHFEHIAIGDICPRGHFCKEGSAFFEGIFFLLTKHMIFRIRELMYHWRELFETSIYFIIVLYYAKASLNKQVKSINHFTIVCLMTWRLYSSEGGGDLALI